MKDETREETKNVLKNNPVIMVSMIVAAYSFFVAIGAILQ